MMRAYDECYLGKARISLAWMFDYAVNGCQLELEEFYRQFLWSSYSKRFAYGESTVIAGMSGVELACRVMQEADSEFSFVKPVFSIDRSPEYWLGHSLAYYQWYRNLSFAQITERIPIGDILLLYRKYHEMDIRQFVDALDEMRADARARQGSRLQEYRRLLRMSQKELAERSGVPLRTIQQYEQGQKNINHARAEYVIALSQVLYCRPEELLEECRFNRCQNKGLKIAEEGKEHNYGKLLKSGQ
jgi:DNA-binding transcriptional regulator YiaG